MKYKIIHNEIGEDENHTDTWCRSDVVMCIYFYFANQRVKFFSGKHFINMYQESFKY